MNTLFCAGLAISRQRELISDHSAPTITVAHRQDDVYVISSEAFGGEQAFCRLCHDGWDMFKVHLVFGIWIDSGFTQRHPLLGLVIGLAKQADISEYAFCYPDELEGRFILPEHMLPNAAAEEVAPC